MNSFLFIIKFKIKKETMEAVEKNYIWLISFTVQLLRTIIAYFIIMVLSLICFLPFIITLALPAKYRYNNKLFFLFGDFFYKGVVRSLSLPINIEGKENLPNQPAILIANHQSSLDIPILGSLCNGHSHIWLILAYYANHPIIGIIVRRMNITVDRDNSVKSVRSLISLIRFLEKYSSHLLMFPEGKRYQDGKIHKFYEGFALIASKTKRPVIPVFMANNYKIFPPNSKMVHYAPIKVIIGPEFLFLPNDTYTSFMTRVQEWFFEQSAKNS